MSTDSASLFAKNRDEVMMTPILPPDQNGPVQGININLGASFGRAANDANYQQPVQQNTVQGPSAAQPSMDDKQRLANDAIGVGQTLQNPAQGMSANKSSVAELGNQVGKTMGQVATGLSSILGAEGVSAQKVRNGAEMEEQQQRMAPPPAQFAMNTPAPGIGSGPGGMG